MLTPLQYNALCDEIAVLYAGLENSIIEDMTRRILRMGFVSDSSAWQTRMLMESGMLYEDILAEIAQRTGQTDRQIRELFRNAGIQAVRNDNFYYRQAGLVVPRTMSDSALQVLNAGYQKCSGSLKNLTLTTANTSQQIFIQTCNLAYMQTISGTMDYNTAVRHAVQSAAGNGAVVRYPSGHRDKLDVAVRRAVLTGVGQTVRQISFQNAKDFDCDLMEISAHAGARPSHAEWQGQIVSLSGRRGYLTLDAIGYGTADGFGGVNCRHDWFPFFEGFSERAYSDERLRELAEHKITIDGVDYSDYELSQKQRYYERQIREKKRQVLAAQIQKDNAQTSADAAAADAEFQKKSVQLKQAEQKLKDFLHQTGFLNDSSRVWVDGFGRSQAQKAVWANRKYQQIKISTAPKSSGTPQNPLTNQAGSGTIKVVPMNRAKTRKREGIKPISNDLFRKLTIEALKNGAIIMRGGEEIESHLDKMGADASTLHDVLFFREEVCISEVIEETYHFKQNMQGMNDDKGEPLRTILNEIDAKQYMLNNARKLRIPRSELELTKRHLIEYQKQLQEYLEGEKNE